MRSHIFNIDTLINLNQEIWIVDKNTPNFPLLKISQSDFKLIKSGIYKSQGNKIEFNGNVYWIPIDLMNKLKVKLKINYSNLENIGISMQEFLNKNIINDIKPNFSLDVISQLKNTNDDIYVFCSKQTKANYESVINKLEERLKEEGLIIKKFYYISETFYNQNDDDIKYKKIRLLLQHLIGYKNDSNKFIDEEVQSYNKIEFYDNQFDTLKIADEINTVLKMLLKNTDDGLKSVIKEDLFDNKPILTVNQISENLVNRKLSKKVNIEYLVFIKTFENFNLKKKENKSNILANKKGELKILIKDICNKMESCEDLKDLEMYNYHKLQLGLKKFLDKCNHIFFERNMIESKVDSYLKKANMYNNTLSDIIDKI